jgi:hypothetical protein
MAETQGTPDCRKERLPTALSSSTAVQHVLGEDGVSVTRPAFLCVF